MNLVSTRNVRLGVGAALAVALLLSAACGSQKDDSAGPDTAAETARESSGTAPSSPVAGAQPSRDRSEAPATAKPQEDSAGQAAQAAKPEQPQSNDTSVAAATETPVPAAEDRDASTGSGGADASTYVAPGSLRPDDLNFDVEVNGRSLEVVTLLPPDAIPAIDNPELISAADADEQLTGGDLVIGLTLNGEHRAYSIAHLSRHEIVNDVVGGKPVAVTW